MKYKGQITYSVTVKPRLLREDAFGLPLIILKLIKFAVYKTQQDLTGIRKHETNTSVAGNRFIYKHFYKH